MISIIHNVYSRNEFIRESVALNVKALKESGLRFQYIIFNDKGDEAIKQDILDVITPDVEYHYSDVNYGMGVCSGGWVGAIPLLKGDYVHNIGQDDVYTTLFYKQLIDQFKDPNLYLVYANGLKVYSDLRIIGQTLGPLTEMSYGNPKQVFNEWFGVVDRTITRSNNFIPAPGVVYRKTLHDLIGPPDLVNYKGSADFEYWARVLYYGLGVAYCPLPTWLYRMSEHSLGSKPGADIKTVEWNNLIIQKYQKWLTQ